MAKIIYFTEKAAQRTLTERPCRKILEAVDHSQATIQDVSHFSSCRCIIRSCIADFNGINRHLEDSPLNCRKPSPRTPRIAGTS